MYRVLQLLLVVVAINIGFENADNLAKSSGMPEPNGLLWAHSFSWSVGLVLLMAPMGDLRKCLLPDGERGCPLQQLGAGTSSLAKPEADSLERWRICLAALAIAECLTGIAWFIADTWKVVKGVKAVENIIVPFLFLPIMCGVLPLCTAAWVFTMRYASTLGRSAVAGEPAFPVTNTHPSL